MLLLLAGANATNTAPVVDAGPTPLNGTTNTPVFLAGSVTDDGLPTGFLSALWTKISGPGITTFDDATDPTTNVTCDTAGTYVLQLEGNDGALTATDTMTLVVSDPPTGGGGTNRWQGLPWR